MESIPGLIKERRKSNMIRKTSNVVMLAVGLLLGSITYAHAAAFMFGDIFASVSSGNVRHYRADGTFLETLNIGAGGYTTGMAFDASGNLYVTGFSAGTVAKFDNNGNLLGNFASGLPTPESIVFDNGGNAYVGTLSGGIRKFDSAGTPLGTSGPGRVDWLDLKADQSTMLYTTESSNIMAVDVSTNTPLADFASGISGSAYALRVLSDGGVLLADGTDVKRLDAGGTVIQTYDIGGEDSWFALNLNPDGNSFWSGNFNSSNLYEFDIASGANTQTLNTGTGGYTLFGVGIFGEQTQGCQNCGGGGNNVVPEPSSLSLLSFGLLGLLKLKKRK